MGDSGIQEPPNEDAFEFSVEVYEFPIYPENTKYIKLLYSTKFLHFKNVSHCSEKAFNFLIQIIGDVLPPIYTLPRTYYKSEKNGEGFEVIIQ